MGSWLTEDSAIIDQICSRYEELAREGEFPDLAEFLASGPDQRRGELLEELICLDYEYRRYAGQSVTEAMYHDQFPDMPLIIEQAFRRIRDRTRSLAADPQQHVQAEAGRRDNQQSDSSQPRNNRSRAGEYQLESFLGRGAFSDVYLGRNSEQKRVAIKILHDRIPDDSGIRDGFTREAETLKLIQHPATVQLLDEFIDETGQPCLVMEYMSGGSLADYAGPAWTYRRIASFIADLAEALHQMHQQGYSHRDVKPANILLDKDNRPKLADVGLALSDKTYGKGPRGTVAGSLAYLSPEQARGDSHLVDGRTDVYSLGVVMYELLTTKRPFVADDTKELLRRIQEIEIRPPRQINSDIPEELEKICLKATDKDPKQRYSTALDFAQALRQFATTRRRSWLIAGAAFALLLIFGYFVPWVGPDSPSSKPRGSIEVSLKVEVSREKGAFFPVTNFQSLQPGDAVRFIASFSEPVYAGLYWLDADGEVVELYPNIPEQGFHGDKPITQLKSPTETDLGWPLEPVGPSEVALLITSWEPIADGLIGDANWSADAFPTVNKLLSYSATPDKITYETLSSRTPEWNPRSLGTTPKQTNDPIRRLVERLRKQVGIIHIEAVHVPIAR